MVVEKLDSPAVVISPKGSSSNNNHQEDSLEGININCYTKTKDFQQQQKQEAEHSATTATVADLESSCSVHSGISSCGTVTTIGGGDDNNSSNNNNNNNRQNQEQRRQQRRSDRKKKLYYSSAPSRTSRAIMDTIAHSRKHVGSSSNSNTAGGTGLTVPTGADFGSSPRGSSSSGTGRSTSISRGGSLSAATGISFPSSAFSTSATPTLTLSAWQYWSRLTDFRQMDLQSALDQMKTLLSTRPHVVYKTSYYRKQTKNHWARDDPAFLFLQGIFLIISAVAYSVAFRMTLTGSISFLLYTVVWNWLGMGIALATLCREIANRQLVGQQTATSTSHVRQQVEWLYAFDIHCNSFFPVFVVLYGAQFFLLPLVLGEGFFPLLLANSLYAVALSWYWYITHLGYRSLPFLGNTEIFLFPIAAIALVFVGSLIGYPFGFGWNAARVMARFYFM